MPHPRPWLTIPSARPLDEVKPFIGKWLSMEYNVALWRDREDGVTELIKSLQGDSYGFTLVGAYPGYAVAVNKLISQAIKFDPNAEWFVAGGDDTWPDPRVSGPDIGSHLTGYFAGTYGVCQPTGDRWEDAGGVIIDRIAGSPWLGREWHRRANDGQGALCPIFSHMFVDEALQWSAKREGVFLQRRDLTHFHNHFTRTSSHGVSHEKSRMPAHLHKWNGNIHWEASEELFKQFKRDYEQKWSPIP